MNWAQVLIVVAAILITIGIYQLPKVVVENEALEESQEMSQQSTLPVNHAVEMDSTALALATTLSEALKLAENKKNSVIFADSLGRLYLKYSMTDSAAKYAQKIFEIDSGSEGRLKAGLLMYSAFELTNSSVEASVLGEKSRELLEPLMERTNDPGIRVKVGMTYMSTANPMQGVMMIRSVLEEDPNNIEALFNLGFLAIQSGQYEKAIERFQKVITLKPDDWNAQLYLGISFLENGRTVDAKKIFQKLADESDSKVLAEIAKSYLNEME